MRGWGDGGMGRWGDEGMRGWGHGEMGKTLRFGTYNLKLLLTLNNSKLKTQNSKLISAAI